VWLGLAAGKQASVAACEEAMATCRTVVLQSFRNVADVPRAIESDANTLKAQSDAAEAAKDSLDLAQKQYLLGG